MRNWQGCQCWVSSKCPQSGLDAGASDSRYDEQAWLAGGATGYAAVYQVPNADAVQTAWAALDISIDCGLAVTLSSPLSSK